MQSHYIVWNGLESILLYNPCPQKASGECRDRKHPIPHPLLWFLLVCSLSEGRINTQWFSKPHSRSASLALSDTRPLASDDPVSHMTTALWLIRCLLLPGSGSTPQLPVLRWISSRGWSVPSGFAKRMRSSPGEEFLMAGNSVRFKSSLAGATNTRVLMGLPTCASSLEFYGKQKEAEVGFHQATHCSGVLG